METHNKLKDLTDHLFCQMERLNSDNLKGEELRDEVAKSNAMCNISEQIIETGKLAIEATKVSFNKATVVKHPLLEDISNNAI